MAKKNTKKSFTPDFVVDLTDATCARDTYAAFADARIKKACADVEVKAFIDILVEKATPVFYLVTADKCQFCKPESVKKPNIFKRFWNWITRKK